MKLYVPLTIFLTTLATLVLGLKSNSDVSNTQPISYSKHNLRTAEELRDGTVDDLLKTAWELYRQNKYDEALANCVKASGLDTKDFRPHYIAGFIRMAQQNLKMASDEFAKAIELKPGEKVIYMYKAEADRKRGAIDEAVAACRKALEIDPSFAEAYLTIADVLRGDEKRRDEAEAAYRAAVKAEPKVPFILESVGENLLYAKKDEKGAEDAFRKAMELDPNHMAGRFPLGRLLVEQNRLKEARVIWEGRTTDKDNTFPNFITLLERAENLKRAKEALTQKPNDPEALLQMGKAVMEGDSWVVDGRQEKAIAYFRQALKLKPDFTAAQYGICKAYIQIADTYKKENKNVDEELKKLQKMDPKLAEELEEYRKTYSGGLIGIPVKPK
jgi:cytochrome c-type biogenesis protein CcmH/NrfG